MKWSFTEHKSTIVCEKVLLFKSIHDSKDSLKKVLKLQIKFGEFDCLTWCWVLFLCYVELISFLSYFLCYLLLCYLVLNHFQLSLNRA